MIIIVNTLARKFFDKYQNYDTPYGEHVELQKDDKEDFLAVFSFFLCGEMIHAKIKEEPFMMISDMTIMALHASEIAESAIHQNYPRDLRFDTEKTRPLLMDAGKFDIHPKKGIIQKWSDATVPSSKPTSEELNLFAEWKQRLHDSAIAGKHVLFFPPPYLVRKFVEYGFCGKSLSVQIEFADGNPGGLWVYEKTGDILNKDFRPQFLSPFQREEGGSSKWLEEKSKKYMSEGFGYLQRMSLHGMLGLSMLIGVALPYAVQNGFDEDYYKELSDKMQNKKQKAKVA